ncbi:hypothetical protein LTR20_007357 [Exophiala xenobiotica]|nr:hypothetical protein LTR79_001738 [Exophiala xenobiotica]KAK5409147.1 hypothetical protein LTR90_009270 [Exophiala xenobiotica]KAK5460050.1 hypothetical protein LTR20_007357 [Exophiala xenobiotica]KAK5488988.1 hypothetical protein LTR26_004304 [Exophiala xenobiotica]
MSAGPSGRNPRAERPQSSLTELDTQPSLEPQGGIAAALIKWAGQHGTFFERPGHRSALFEGGNFSHLYSYLCEFQECQEIENIRSRLLCLAIFDAAVGSGYHQCGSWVHGGRTALARVIRQDQDDQRNKIEVDLERYIDLGYGFNLWSKALEERACLLLIPAELSKNRHNRKHIEEEARIYKAQNIKGIAQRWGLVELTNSVMTHCRVDLPIFESDGPSSSRFRCSHTASSAIRDRSRPRQPTPDTSTSPEGIGQPVEAAPVPREVVEATFTSAEVDSMGQCNDVSSHEINAMGKFFDFDRAAGEIDG